MPNYKEIIIDGVSQVYTESVADSQRYDVSVAGGVPAGAVATPLTERVANVYLPSPQKRILNYPSWQKGKFFLAMDARPSNINFTQWLAKGFGRVTNFNADPANSYESLQNNQKFYQSPESQIHPGILEGFGFYDTPLPAMETNYMNNCPQLGAGAMWSANIETSNHCNPDMFFRDGMAPVKGFPSWDSVKNKSTFCEIDSLVRTYGQLADQGLFTSEMTTRYSNRVTILMQVAGRNGAKVAFGSSMWQGDPRTDCLQTGGRFLDAGTRFDFIEGYNAQTKTITLNNRVYQTPSSFYKLEDWHLSYYYYVFLREYTGSNFESEADYLSLWPKLYNNHPVAGEIGHIMANQKRMVDVHGQVIPHVRQTQPHYEIQSGNGFTPAAWNLGPESKIMQPPYLNYTLSAINYMVEGENEYSGNYAFANYITNLQLGHGVIDMNDQANHPYFNYHQHALEAFACAHADLAPYSWMLENGTLSFDLDFKNQGSSNWNITNGVLAFGQKPDGSFNERVPCGLTRHLQTDAGLHVLLLVGMEQYWEQTRTDLVRIPSIMRTNTIQVTYRGPGAHIFHVYIPNSTSNTTYVAKAVPASYFRAGYSGLVN